MAVMPSMTGISRSISTTSGCSSLRQLQRLGAVSRLADDLQLRVEREEHLQTLPHDAVVVGDQNADRHGYLRLLADALSSAEGLNVGTVRSPATGHRLRGTNVPEDVMIKLLLVDDDPNVLWGLRMRLALESDITIVGEANDGAAAVAKTVALHPDVVVMDVQMPVMDG